jgi:DNA-binding SARP family transcriptional activator/pimeloyl-ACP methyl ester carboxylesterase
MPMEFRLLGPLEVLDGDTSVALGPPKQRALLARLLLAEGRTVAVDQFVDDLWGGDVPDSAVKMIQIHVSHLRRLLPAGMLLTRAPGYALEIDSAALDIVRFTRLRERGRAASASGDPAGAAALLTEALELWRGPALGEFSEPFAVVERAHLEEQHLACREDRVEAELALGRHADLVGELEMLVRGHPLRERLRGQLMLALYRSGRQAEALESYRQFRASLDEELGIEPSPALRELERRILQQDPQLSGPRAAPTSVPSLPEHPDVNYVTSGDVSIAYQVIGDGPLDIVLVHGWVCTFAAGWEREQIAGFYRRLASIGRLILFDKRGTGMSDRALGVATLEERMDDVRAVMDAAGSERAALIGISEGGPMVTLFAATYPERTVALIGIGTFARRTPASEYPIDIPRPPVTSESWGTPAAMRDYVAARAPSIVHDEDAVRWYGWYFAQGASPGAAIALQAMNGEIDVRDVLPTIGVPTLMLYRTDEYMREATRYMGDRIPEARVVALPGADHLPWEGDQDAVLDEIERFLAAAGDDVGPDHIVTTVLTLRVGDDGARERAVFRNQLPRFRGTAISDTSARFDGPARAIRCARSILERAGPDVRLGLHTGQCVVVGGQTSGEAVDVSERLADMAAPGEILVSSTVRDLAAGSGISLAASSAEPGLFVAG